MVEEDLLTAALMAFLDHVDRLVRTEVENQVFGESPRAEFPAFGQLPYMRNQV